MIRFSINYDDFNVLGKAQYIENENSFFYEPWNDADFSIMLGNGYNSLDVDLSTKYTLQLTGLNPKHNWIEQDIVAPIAKQGYLIALLDDDYQSGTGIQYVTGWETYFNPKTGWVCIGCPKHSDNSEIVLFADNTIAVIENEHLCAVWIKPIFV